MIGAPNFSGYCQYVGYAGAKSLNSSAYGWVCYSDNRMNAINANDVCRWQFGLNAVADAADINNANSWQCWAVG